MSPSLYAISCGKPQGEHNNFIYLVLYKIWIQRRNSVYSAEHMNVILSRDYVFNGVCIYTV